VTTQLQLINIILLLLLLLLLLWPKHLLSTSVKTISVITDFDYNGSF